MKLPVLVAAAVVTVLLTGAYAQTAPSGTNVPPPTTTMPNANGTPESPATGTMPNADGTISSGGRVTPGGTAGATSPTTPLPPQCVPNATNSCPQPSCQPGTTAGTMTPGGTSCPPPVQGH